MLRSGASQGEGAEATESSAIPLQGLGRQLPRIKGMTLEATLETGTLFQIIQFFYLVLIEKLPYMIFIEMILYIVIVVGAVRYATERPKVLPPQYAPRVSCLVTCYSEGWDVQKTIRSLINQIYPGMIDIIVLIDGAAKNVITLEAANAMRAEAQNNPHVTLTVLPKKQRGGTVSSLNLGLNFAKGDVVMALDGDTSFDNDMVAKAVQHFQDKNVVAIGGALRVRNRASGFVTMFQGIEYLLGIHMTRTGLAAFNIVNTISGAFGVFRTETVRKIGGWSSGSSQDLDITFRLNAYFGRYKHLRMSFEPMSIGHTDVPDTWKGLFRQRLRWDGDLVYIYLRKRASLFRPALLGWGGLIYQTFIGVFISTVMPVFTSVYVIWAAITQDMASFAVLMGVMYFYYTFVTFVLFFVFIVCISERIKHDLWYLPLLPFYPIYTLVLRFVSAYAILWELIARSHLDSSMAPWWVLRRSK